MRVFRLTENKLIYLVLANVGSKKNSFLYEVTLAAWLKSLISTDIFPNTEKSAILFYFNFFFYLEVPHYRVVAILLTRMLEKSD